MKMPRFVIRLIPILILWYIITFFLFNAAQGPNRLFALGNNYILVDFPGWIMRVKSSEEYKESLEKYDPNTEMRPPDWEPVTGNKPPIVAFCVKGQWVFGKTEKGWFVLNTEKKEIHAPCFSIGIVGKEDGWDVIKEENKDVNIPCNSLDEVRKISGINITEKDLITEYPTSEFWPSRYEIINPAAKGVLKFTTALFLPLMIIAIIGFGRTFRNLFAPFILLKRIFKKA